VPPPNNFDLDAWIVPPPLDIQESTPSTHVDISAEKKRKDKKGKTKVANGARKKKEGAPEGDILTPVEAPEETPAEKTERERVRGNFALRTYLIPPTEKSGATCATAR
jgi:AP-3 complex subunit delta